MSNPSSQNSVSTLAASEPIRLDGAVDEGFDIARYRETKEAKELAAWVRTEHDRAKQARSHKQLQWRMNMAFFYGQHWLEITGKNYPEGFRGKLELPKKPYYKARMTINRTRAFVRSEMNQFLASTPQAIAVPATAEDQDVRSAYAAEQAWQSISESQKLNSHYARACWWTIVTGTGFIKTWWDDTAIDKASGQTGAIRYGNVTPFHLFVPDLREQEIDDQPYVINAYTKPLSWCHHYYGKALEGVNLQASTTTANSILDEGMLNLGEGGKTTYDSVIVYETWAKPGAHKYLPEGGVIISIDDVIVDIHRSGMPYQHGQYPFTKFEHIPTATFYGDSPLVDLNPLQKEYNELRSQISDAAKKMGRPQILAVKGSITASKITNETGLVIEYNPGYNPPQPMPLQPLPDYIVSQQDRVLSDIEDIGGQHDVSRGTAPAGVTAGTAINFLQEADNSFRTTQFLGIEAGYERIAGQTIGLFVQCVDVKRKIKTIGADGAFDTQLLSGSDVSGGTDIRIQKGTSVGTSKAANDAKVMDMFAMGVIQDPNMALRLLEVGGAQKILDIMNVAEKKAQRENIKMKMLKVSDLEARQEQEASRIEMEQTLQAIQQQLEPAPIDEMTGQPVEEALPDPIKPEPVIKVDDFDIHEKHIEIHNMFRMSQEYEMLHPLVRAEFDMHCQAHEDKLEQKALMSFLDAMPSDGSDGGPQEGDMEVPLPGAEEETGPGDTLAENGAAPDMAPDTGGF